MVATVERKSRFQIEPLEERVAPGVAWSVAWDRVTAFSATSFGASFASGNGLLVAQAQAGAILGGAAAASSAIAVVTP